MTLLMPTRRGSLLIITLWVIVILSALAVAIARQLSRELRVTKYRLARQQAMVLARGGVYLAVRILQQDETPADWLGDGWASPQTFAPLPGWQVAISIMDEERKLNVNRASLEQLSRLTGQETIAQAIIDEVDGLEPTEDAPTAQPPYYAKNAPLIALEELHHVPGMEADVEEMLRGFATPHGGGTPNINTVVSKVLVALGISPEGVERVSHYREGVDGPEAHGADHVFEQEQLLNTLQELELEDTDLNILSGLVTSSQTFTVVSEAVATQPILRARVTAVIQRSSGGEEAPPRIIAWREG